MDKDRQLAKELAKEMSFKEKAKHFWYYYKAHTLALIFAIVIIAWGAVQCANRVDYDLDISFFSESYVSDEALEKFDLFLENLCDDVNENGAVDAQVYPFSGEISGEYVDQYAQANLTKLQSEIAMGECPAYIVDEAYKNYIEMLTEDMNVIDKITEITDVPIIRETFNPGENMKLYFISILEYDTQKGNEELRKERENMKKVEQYFIDRIEK